MRPNPFRARSEARAGLCSHGGYMPAETVWVRGRSPRQNQTGRALPAACGLERVARGVAVGMLVLLGMLPALCAQTLSLRIEPGTIRKGFFYNGTTVQVEGIAPPATNIVVIVRGDETSELFNKKGRFGPLWINTDRIHIANVPAIFLSYSSAPIPSILDPSSIDTYQLDESSLKRHLTSRCHCNCPTIGPVQGRSIASCKGVKPDPQYAATIRDSFLDLKQRDGSYQFHPGAVQLAASPQGTHYSLRLDWPNSARMGAYQVEVYACKNQSVVARTVTPLNVVQVGFPLYMADLAMSRPWAYGIVAVLTAVLAGFTIDAITSRLRRRSPRRVSQTAEVAAARAPDAAPEAGSRVLEDRVEQEPVH